ncbi:MAG: hypothetical protein WD208_12870 [Dehalococcoidia bacterium]
MIPEDSNGRGPSNKARMIAGGAANLLLSGAVSYGLFLIALSVGLDGPSSFTGMEAAGILSGATALATLGIGASALTGWLLARHVMVVLVASFPGLIASMFLLRLIATDVLSKAS